MTRLRRIADTLANATDDALDAWDRLLPWIVGPLAIFGAAALAALAWFWLNLWLWPEGL